MNKISRVYVKKKKKKLKRNVRKVISATRDNEIINIKTTFV